MRIVKLLSALSLVASAPCVASGQNPPPAPAPAPRSEAPGAQAHRVEVRRMMVGRDAMPAMMLAGRMGGMAMSVSEMFLAHTGDLQLTDAQVTKLAAIARRSDARQKAMRARMDSSMHAMHERMDASRDGGRLADAMMMMRVPMPSDADRKAQHEDDREAFTIVTPDQMATAWEMMMMHHRH